VTPVRVAVVEDHPVYRDGLAAAFDDAPDVELIAAVATIADTLDLLARRTIDVLLLDLGLPDGSGLDLLSTLHVRHPRTAVVVLTMNDERKMVLDAVRAGARGYLLKGAGRAEIIDAVRRAASGGAVFSTGPADVVITAASRALDDPAVALGLTPREGARARVARRRTEQPGHSCPARVGPQDSPQPGIHDLHQARRQKPRRRRQTGPLSRPMSHHRVESSFLPREANAVNGTSATSASLTHCRSCSSKTAFG
jgi:DNA-binding NarL/FixJ family response regulator